MVLQLELSKFLCILFIDDKLTITITSGRIDVEVAIHDSIPRGTN